MLFHSNRISFFLPDFVEIQRKSFLFFLRKGLIRELAKRNPITNPTNDFELIFYPDYYQLNPPEWTPKQTILKLKTYACRLYVPTQLINNSTKEVKLQWVLIGNLPLMTKRGHFIINGSPRVIINQMVRSPGIYYQENVDKNKKRTYYADLISHRGTWLRLETDKKRRVWARMKKNPKVSILIFLQAMGLSKETIFQSIRYSEFLKNSFLKEDHPCSTEQALITLYSKTHPKKDKTEITSEMGQNFLNRKFMNPRTYDLGQMGRIKLNKKLGLSVPLNISILTPQDILFSIDYLLKLEHGLGTIDDIDHLKNRRVRASGELIQNQVGTGLIRLEKTIREKIKKPKNKLTIRGLITTKPINGALREFFGSSPLSQFMDQTNPLAEITHKRRLSSLGPGGVSRETAGMAVRGIHPSHYGRICPIETPEGPNAGLVNSITTYAKISSEGFVETPFFSVYQGQVQKKTGPIFFSAEHEENINIAPGDLKNNLLNFLPKNFIPIRSSEEFKRVSRNQVEYIAISPIQMISIATSLIPFLEHDDANRALMGSNMQRQAVPLIAPERPIVGTGLESRVVSDCGHILQSKNSGFISYVSGDNIIVQDFYLKKLNNIQFNKNSNINTKNKSQYKVSKKSDLEKTSFYWSTNNIVEDTQCCQSIISSIVFKSKYLKNSKNSFFFKTLKLKNNFKPKSFKFVKTAANKIYKVSKEPDFQETKNKLFSFSSNFPVFTKFLPKKQFRYKYRKISNKLVFEKTDFFREKLVSKKISLKMIVEIKFNKNLKLLKKQLLVLFFNKTKNLSYFPFWIFFCYFLTNSKQFKTYKLKNKNSFLKTKSLINRKLEKTPITLMKQSFCSFKKNQYTDWNTPRIHFNFRNFSFFGEKSFSNQVTINFNYLLNSKFSENKGALLGTPKNFKYNSFSYDLQSYQRSNQDTCLNQRPIVQEGEWVQKGDLLADGTASVGGELSLGKTILICYMPWEGYNFEDAILINERLVYDDVYTSIHIERYEVEIRDTKFGIEQISNQIPEIGFFEISHLDNNGIAKIGTWVKEADIVVGKITPIQKKPLSPHEKLLYDIVGKDIPTTRDTSLRLPKSVEGRIIDVQTLETENIPPEIDFEGPGRVHIYIAEKRKIQVGDKMAGRHGNKGIVSRILPRQDMPYLPDGTPIDMVLNPLGVPSRMNVGQVFECLLGLAGKYLDQQFKITPFDEINGPEASRSLVYSKLYEARLKTNQDWLFNPNFPGKIKLFDGRTGECFDQPVTVGQAYMLKLVHLVDEKIHARSTGPYSLVTQQPLRGRSKHGGQRLGEMEVWALEGFGAAYTLQELLTLKSDDMKGRHQVMDAILNNKPISLGTPESFKVLIRELQSLCLDVGVYTIDSTGHRKQIDVMKLP